MRRYKLLFLILIIGCKPKVDSTSSQVKPFETHSNPQEQLKPQENKQITELTFDSLYFDSVFINQRIPLKLSEKELQNKLGPADSVVVEGGWECGNYISNSDSVTVYYYGHSRYIASSGIALLHTLVLSDKLLTFNISGFSFSSPVQESEIERLFPIPYNNMIEQIKSNENDRERSLVVGMIESPRFEDNSGFIFHFDKGLLVKIELWWFIC